MPGAFGVVGRPVENRLIHRKGINGPVGQGIMQAGLVAIGDQVGQSGDTAGFVLISRPAQALFFKDGKGHRIIDDAKNLAIKIGKAADAGIASPAT